MRLLGYALSLTVLAATPGFAAPARSAARKPPAAVAGLKSITVAPAAVVLLGARDEQGLVVTGQFEGGPKDQTARAQITVADPKIVSLTADPNDPARRVLRPVADGTTAVTVSLPGAAPVTVRVSVRNAREVRPVSFRDEVVPALTKAGCNQGVCHGTPTGKGGLRLSLQGYAPDLDYQCIAREGNARRIIPADPGRSLFLLKPMVEVPHGGGKRLTPDMPEFRVLSRWIAEGAHDDPPNAPTLKSVEILPGERAMLLPGAKQQIAVVAQFSDGSKRDVTSLAKLSTSDDDAVTVSREGLVEGLKRGSVAVLVRYQYELQTLPFTLIQNVPGFQWNNPPANNYVDELAYNRLKLFQIPASDLSSDTEFLRRAYLDTLGLLPQPEEVRAFLADNAPDKRARLIDQLTQRPEFADYWAVKWADVLRIQDETLKEEGARAFFKWVRDSIAGNKPMDRFVHEILTGTGDTVQHPPAGYYRTNTEPEDTSQATAQLFLGVRVSCARCHNHPYDRWTQDEYYHLAAFFAQVRTKGGRHDDSDTIYIDPDGEVTHPRTGKTMRPKFLGGAFAQVKDGEDRRKALADWIVAKENPFFAKEMVNRTWANVLGRGLVEPIDDFRSSNPSVNQPLLDALAKDFVDHNYDFRYLVRTIMKSRTYQLTAKSLPLNRDDQLYYSHALPRLLTAEQLSDALTQVTGVPEEFEGYPVGTRAMQVAGTKSRSPFMKVFGRPDRNLNCECEREKEPNLFEALAMISGRNVHNKLHSDDGRIADLARKQVPYPQAVEEMYLSTLTRLPTEKEKTGWLSYLGKATDRRQALEDLGWVLINSKEFLYRH